MIDYDNQGTRDTDNGFSWALFFSKHVNMGYPFPCFISLRHFVLPVLFKSRVSNTL